MSAADDLIVDSIVYPLINLVSKGAPVDKVVPLIALIKATISPLEWDTMGGDGAIAPFLPAPDGWWRLVIRCTKGTHKLIAPILKTLTEAAETDDT